MSATEEAMTDVLPAVLTAPQEQAYTTEESHAWCRAYTKERASNFYYAFSVLPDTKRNAIYAAYSFSGYVDDIVDELQDHDEQVRLLTEARARMHACAGGEREGPLFTALGEAFDDFAIPAEFFDRLVNGVEMDFTINRYQTWEELYEYCYHVASMVGLICTSIFGARGGEAATRAAIDLGIGLQVINIMRDVREDGLRDRVYFPQDELDRFGLTSGDILNGVYDERFVALMKLQSRRARAYYQKGRKLLPLLDLRSRMCVNVLQGMYFEILKRIEKRNFDVMSERVSLSTPAKLAVVARLSGSAALIRAKQ
jgi:phytoene synthase